MSEVENQSAVYDADRAEITVLEDPSSTTGGKFRKFLPRLFGLLPQDANKASFLGRTFDSVELYYCNNRVYAVASSEEGWYWYAAGPLPEDGIWPHPHSAVSLRVAIRVARFRGYEYPINENQLIALKALEEYDFQRAGYESSQLSHEEFIHIIHNSFAQTHTPSTMKKEDETKMTTANPLDVLKKQLA